MTVSNSINEPTTGIVGMTGTGFTATPVTQYNVQVGGATISTLASVAPSATTGVPLISQGAASNPAFGTAVVAGGGTGVTSNTAYAVLCGGSTATGPIQSIAGVGSAGEVLTSNGAGTLPTFQAISGGGVGSNSNTNIFDDLGGLGTISVLGYPSPYVKGIASGAAGTQVIQKQTAEATNPGIYQLETGTTTTGYSYLAGTSFAVSGGAWECEWLIKIEDLSIAAQRFNIYCGVGDDGGLGAEPQSGFYFHYRDDVNSGNWVGKTANAASRSSANSTDAVAADVWIKLKVAINAGATSVSFYYNGVEIDNSPLATNIPASTTGLFPYFAIVKTAGTTERIAYADYMSLSGTLTSAR